MALDNLRNKHLLSSATLGGGDSAKLSLLQSFTKPHSSALQSTLLMRQPLTTTTATKSALLLGPQNTDQTKLYTSGARPNILSKGSGLSNTLLASLERSETSSSGEYSDDDSDHIDQRADPSAPSLAARGIFRGRKVAIDLAIPTKRDISLLVQRQGGIATFVISKDVSGWWWWWCWWW